MKENARNFIVGLVAIVGLVGFAGLLMSFGELDQLINPRYRVLIRADNAAGLRPGSPIEYSGVPIGVIDSISIVRDPQYPVEITCMINNDVQLPSNVEPFTITQLIGGGARLQLNVPNEPASDIFLPTDGTAVITAHIRGGIFEQFTAELDARMQPILAGLESFNTLSATYIELGNNLNDLLVLQNESDFAAGAQPNLRTAVLRLNRALDEVTEGLALVKEWLGDEQMRADAQLAVSRARQLIEEATTAVNHYTKLADTLQADADEIAQRLMPVIDQLAATLEDVRRVTQAATQGQGTVAQLLNNPDLYNSLYDAAIRLERALVEAQLLLQKLRAEGVRIGL